ncbi:hypothetical protein GW17_00046386 [Ensete ventricosum]|nr:hypothetical protein GW17_00046386 [Ensete ventricosum]
MTDCGQPAGVVAHRRPHIEAQTHRRPPTEATARRHNRLQAQPLIAWCPQGLPAAGRPQGAAASRGSSVGHRGGRPLVRRLQMGKGNRCLRRGSGGGGGAVRVKEG